MSFTTTVFRLWLGIGYCWTMGVPPCGRNRTVISAVSVPGLVSARRVLKLPVDPSASSHVFGMNGSVPLRNSSMLETPSPSGSAVMSLMPKRAFHESRVSSVGDVGETTAR